MRFEPIYYRDRITVLNPTGDVGLCCLWTPVKTALKWIKEAGDDASRIAAVGNLYGDGLPQMIRNLTWNPQIKHLIVCGQDLSGSAAALGEAMAGTGINVVRISMTELKQRGIAPALSCLPAATEPPGDDMRFAEPLPVFRPEVFPSDIGGHQIIALTPLDAWEAVVHRIMRFGVPSIASKVKERRELLNLKVVVRRPHYENFDHLKQRGFSHVELHEYQDDILSPEVPDGIAYTYGQRIRAIDAGDPLLEVARKLRADPTTRSGYISIWDTGRDLFGSEPGGHPCLVALAFRVMDGRLHLAATFRSHNALSAWLRNVYGLMAIQQFVQEEAGISLEMPPGPITIISHSITIDPAATERMEIARQVIADRESDDEVDRDTGKRHLREDPCGYFEVTADHGRGLIVAQHRHDGKAIATYEGKTAVEIERQIARDCAVSLVSHAMFIGRELHRCEVALRTRTCACGSDCLD